MADKVEQFARRKRGRPAIYDWDSCFDGEIHRFFQGQDFTVTLESFRALVHRTASARIEGGPWKATTQIDRDNKSVAFTFYNA